MKKYRKSNTIMENPTQGEGSIYEREGRDEGKKLGKNVEKERRRQGRNKGRKDWHKERRVHKGKEDRQKVRKGT